MLLDYPAPTQCHSDGVVETIQCKADGSTRVEAVRINGCEIVAGTEEIIASGTAREHSGDVTRRSI